MVVMTKAELNPNANYIMVPRWITVLTVPILMTLIVWTIGAAWFMATLTSQVNINTTRIERAANVDNRITRLEVRFDTIANQNSEIINLLRGQNQVKDYSDVPREGLDTQN